MILGQPLFAIIDPATNQVFGTRDASAISEAWPDAKELAFVREFCRCPAAKIVKCKLVFDGDVATNGFGD